MTLLTVTKRKLWVSILIGLMIFYSLGTGFAFFFRLLYAIFITIGIGLVWAWFNLKGLEIHLNRTIWHGHVGDFLGGELQIVNHYRLPKSWISVKEISTIPGYTSGRAIGLVKNQRRSWLIEHQLAVRGKYLCGEIEVISQDPFGLFQLRRTFLSSREFTVFPRTELLPDLNPQLSNLPSDAKSTHRSDHITTDSATIRTYRPGDSPRRIHWPYTAKMNTLMVKEFEAGVSAESWVVMDMHNQSHVGEDPIDNSEELAVTVASSLINKLISLSIPVGLTANSGSYYKFRPDRNTAHMQNIMQALASIRANGRIRLSHFIYDLEHQLNRFSSLIVVTPSTRTDWIDALAFLKSKGIKISVIYINPSEFNSSSESNQTIQTLLENEILSYVVHKNQPINECLKYPIQTLLNP